MPDSSQDLDTIARRTLGHYDVNAVDYEAGTRDHDVRQNVDALWRHLPAARNEAAAPASILDFGCGPGRDLPTLAARGHVVVGLDGSEAFVAIARAATGATVWQQNFFALDLPPDRFDGIFANATLQHVPTVVLPRVLSQLHATLRPQGVLFASIPHGDDEEGWNGERYSAFHSVARWRALLSAAGFAEVEHHFRPAGVPVEQQRWFASAWRKAPLGASQPG